MPRKRLSRFRPLVLPFLSIPYSPELLNLLNNAGENDEGELGRPIGQCAVVPNTPTASAASGSFYPRGNTRTRTPPTSPSGLSSLATPSSSVMDGCMNQPFGGPSCSRGLPRDIKDMFECKPCNCHMEKAIFEVHVCPHAHF
ncbi:hypothetical protein M422DRAFT_53353 [Sphaerobolus stellatus SS14]|uniref:Uncharacterized protein n=1 Tax=Sphaerobolus stellatus (strain SS14) TaxID=990650 RepID=A0A0C9UQZ5_SPHS4|nr:hypothetical protein M422DRAFT_53353 [Sphaerobolus stellatus SS14]